MFGVDDVVLVFAVTTAVNIVIELGAEIVAEWVLQPSGSGIGASTFLAVQVAEPGCSPQTASMFTTLVDNVGHGVNCSGVTLTECIEACPVLLKLAAY